MRNGIVNSLNADCYFCKHGEGSLMMQCVSDFRNSFHVLLIWVLFKGIIFLSSRYWSLIYKYRRPWILVAPESGAQPLFTFP